MEWPFRTPQAKKEAEEAEPAHRWWEEEELPDGQKWTTLEHNGPLFPDPYNPLPARVKLKWVLTPTQLNAYPFASAIKAP